jgi:hypothetical protein
VQSPTKQLEPLDRLVREHEADVAIADIATPTSHGRCRHILLKQAVRDLNAVESQRGDAEEEGPGSSRAKTLADRGAGEASRRVAADTRRSRG